ncbi:hypothetical protein IKF23_04230 [Candidatus Saccharibacteria bacterium]|nr:hypothetical protein [Candidatus Saccharibacteria bacterium]
MENLLNNQNNVGAEDPSMEWDLTMAAERKEREKAERLQRAIDEAEQKGKEAFDYKKFVESYWRKDAFFEPLNGNEDERMADHYRKSYYLDFPDAMTIEEFALALEKRDESLEE